MIDLSCKLLSTTYISNSIGTQIEEKKVTEIPIIRVEDIYANEYYKASQNGMKPTLRIRISCLNYDNQSELIYMDQEYTIIRTQAITVDEVILVCERKIKNVK